MSKKILIKAYTNLNLGDDLFIKILCDRYPKHQFYLIGLKAKEEPFKDIKNLTYIYSVRYIDRILNELNINFRINESIELYYAKKFDFVIHIGGSLYIESQHYSWVRQINHYESLVNDSNNFITIGCNFGPYESEWFPVRMHEVFKKMDDICFRDEYSYNLYADLVNTRLAPDIVFSLNDSYIEEIEAFLADEYIVISVIDLTWREGLKKYTDLYEESIVNISKRLISLGKKVVLMSFCKSEGDEYAIQRIMEKYPSEHIISYFYNGNISESLSVLKHSEGIIATRFHSLILGWIFNKTVFPFEYSNKTENLLKDINYDGYHLPINDIASIQIDSVINQLIEKKPQNILNEQKEAEKHFLKTDLFLA